MTGLQTLVPCPECHLRFKSRNAMLSHKSDSHPTNQNLRDCADCGRQFYTSADIEKCDNCRLVTLTCVVCGETFDVPVDSDKTHHRCGNCQGTETVECETCGDVFAVRRSQADERRFCSNECQHDDSRTRLQCVECGDEFTVWNSHADGRLYCGQECRSAAKPDREADEFETVAFAGAQAKCVHVPAPSSEASPICGKKSNKTYTNDPHGIYQGFRLIEQAKVPNRDLCESCDERLKQFEEPPEVDTQ